MARYEIIVGSQSKNYLNLAQFYSALKQFQALYEQAVYTSDYQPVTNIYQLYKAIALALNDTKLCGFMGMTGVASTAVLASSYVVPEHRKNNLWSHMADALIDEARGKGFKVLRAIPASQNVLNLNKKLENKGFKKEPELGLYQKSLT